MSNPGEPRRAASRVVEGYLVPVDLRNVASDLDALFVQELGGSGLGGPGPRPPDLIARIDQLVSRVVMSASDDEGTEVALRLDPGRLYEVDEAWAPVLTPDGPGVLVWMNSD